MTTTLTLPTDIGSIAAWAAVLTGLITLIAVFIQERSAARALRTSTLLQLWEQFNGEQMIADRVRAAEGLLELRCGKRKTEVRNLVSLEHVLNHFDMVGYLVHRNVIDQGSAKVMFKYWLVRYWQAADDYISPAQQSDPSLWDEAAGLYSDFTAPARSAPIIPVPIQPEGARRFVGSEELSQFLTDEIALAKG